jgi:hypothetical protein
MEFKLGDKVEAISNSSCCYAIGDKGKVISVYNNGNADIRFEDGEVICYCNPENFKLAGEEKKYIIYDKTSDCYYNVADTKERCLSKLSGCKDDYELVELGVIIPVIKKTIYTLEGE